MKIFDTHCHYNLEPLYSGKPEYFSDKQLKTIQDMNWEDHWQQAQNQGVVTSLIPGTNVKTSQRALEIAQTDSNLLASAALHPNSVIELTQQQLDRNFNQIKSIATQTQIVAIGETGLDYANLSADKNKKLQNKQQQLFKKHIQLANQLHKPLIIHARDRKHAYQVYDDILKILKQEYNFKQPFVLHCASGSQTYIQQALELDAYVSFAGNITYPNATDLHNLIKLVPKNKLLIETDAPFLPPQPYRGKINQPKMITTTADFIQHKLKINIKQVLANSYQFYQVQS
jgi:TatD DNase family protein